MVCRYQKEEESKWVDWGAPEMITMGGVIGSGGDGGCGHSRHSPLDHFRSLSCSVYRGKSLYSGHAWSVSGSPSLRHKRRKRKEKSNDSK